MIRAFKGPVVRYEWPDIQGFPQLSPLVAGYEEKIRSFARRAGLQMAGDDDQGRVNLAISVVNDSSTELVGIAKSVMDALTGVAYRDDRSVRELDVWRTVCPDCGPGIVVFVRREELVRAGVKVTYDDARIFGVPGTPVTKGIPFAGSIHTSIVLDKHAADELTQYFRDTRQPYFSVEDGVSTDICADFSIVYESGLNDVDNVARIYLIAARQLGVIADPRSIVSFHFGALPVAEYNLEPVRLAFISRDIWPNWEGRETTISHLVGNKEYPKAFLT